mgnify:CR=1 FL=1
MLMITLYKDLKGISYNKLKNELEGTFQLSVNSYHHNVYAVREALRCWSKNVLTVPQLDKLKAIARGQVQAKSFPNVQLWMDSTEFRLIGNRSMHATNPYWSKKVKGHGRKWLFLHDARGRVVFAFGPVSPKAYDSHLFCRHMETVEKALPGAVIIADNHFRKAAEITEKVTLVTNISKAGRPRMVKGKRMKRTLTSDQEAHNADVSFIRGRVEAPYGHWQNLFKTLDKPFGDSPDQLDCLVRFAAAVHRLKVE